MTAKNPVVHFEMPYQDAKRVSEFYEQAFGWNMRDLGESMGHYITAGTAETDENNMVKTPGTINGGFFLKQSQGPTLFPSVVIAVENIEEAIQKVKKAGGQIIDAPIEIPGIGQYVSFNDTEGNRASLLQAKRMA